MGSGNVGAAHKRHFKSVFMNFASNYTVGNPADDISYGCAKCHQLSVLGQRAAFVEKNNGKITDVIVGQGFGQDVEGDISYNRPDPYNVARKQVNTEFCRQCHGTFPKSKHQDIDYAADSPRICITCHKDGGMGLAPEIAHGAGPPYKETTAPFSSTQTPPLPSSPGGPALGGIWWIDQRYATEAYCVKCHGELDWFVAEETNPSADPSASCLNCHSAYGNTQNFGAAPGGVAPPDIESKMLLSVVHPVTEINLNTAERVMQCIDCHMPPSASAYEDNVDHHRDGVVQKGTGSDALILAGGSKMRVSTETKDYYMWEDTGVSSTTVESAGPCFNCHSEARLIGLEPASTYDGVFNPPDFESHYWSRIKANPLDPYPIDLPQAPILTRQGTNFRLDTILENTNLHWEHLDLNWDDTNVAPDPKSQLGFVWDWNNNGPWLFGPPDVLPGGDNARPNCPTCHDPHGSKWAAMTSFSTTLAFPAFTEGPASGLPGIIFNDNLCSACHGDSPYGRTRLPYSAKNLKATPGTGQVTLIWDNRDSSSWLSGTRKTKIMRKTSGYPEHENDGTMAADVDSAATASTYVDTGVTPGTTYYYRLFTHYTGDTIYGTSPRAQVIVAPQ